MAVLKNRPVGDIYSQKPGIAIASRNFTSMNSVTRIGMIPDLDKEVTSDIWTLGGKAGGYSEYPWPESEDFLYISSDSPDDNISGTGARRLRVNGINQAGVFQVEHIELDGTNPVQTANKYFRSARMSVCETGDSGFNQGSITGTVGGDPFFHIPPLHNRNLIAVGSVARLRGGYITQVHGSICGNRNAQVSITTWIRDSPTAPFIIMDQHNLSCAGTSHFTHDMDVATIYVPAQGDFKLTAYSSHKDTVVSAGAVVVFISPP